jgi:hypothetical protein
MGIEVLWTTRWAFNNQFWDLLYHFEDNVKSCSTPAANYFKLLQQQVFYWHCPSFLFGYLSSRAMPLPNGCPECALLRICLAQNIPCPEYATNPDQWRISCSRCTNTPPHICPFN